MEGAYLVWNPLLMAICQDHSSFLGQLISKLLDPLTISHTAADIEDVDREAMTLWLISLTEYPSSASNSSQRVRATTKTAANQYRAQILKICCLYPDIWTQQLGKELLRTSDSEIAENWTELVAAVDFNTESASSLIDEASLDSMMAQRSELTHRRHNAPWTRAIVVPRVPIGVVI